MEYEVRREEMDCTTLDKYRRAGIDDILDIVRAARGQGLATDEDVEGAEAALRAIGCYGATIPVDAFYQDDRLVGLRVEVRGKGFLGTPDFMERIQGLMERAKKAAPAGSVYARRAELLDKGILQLMINNRRHYLAATTK